MLFLVFLSKNITPPNLPFVVNCVVVDVVVVLFASVSGVIVDTGTQSAGGGRGCHSSSAPVVAFFSGSPSTFVQVMSPGRSVVVVVVVVIVGAAAGIVDGNSTLTASVAWVDVIVVMGVAVL